MAFRSKILALVAATAGVLVFPTVSKAQPLTTNPLVGVWKLVSFESRSYNGEVSYPMGKYPIGLLTYDVKGRVANQLMEPNRPAFKTGDRRRGTPEEIKAAFEGFSAYYGTYRIDEKQGRVLQRIEVSSFPNEVWTEVERFFEISGSRLTLRTPRRVLAGQASQRWYGSVWNRLLQTVALTSVTLARPIGSPVPAQSTIPLIVAFVAGGAF